MLRPQQIGSRSFDGKPEKRRGIERAVRGCSRSDWRSFASIPKGYWFFVTSISLSVHRKKLAILSFWTKRRDSHDRYPIKDQVWGCRDDFNHIYGGRGDFSRPYPTLKMKGDRLLASSLRSAPTRHLRA